MFFSLPEDMRSGGGHIMWIPHDLFSGYDVNYFMREMVKEHNVKLMYWFIMNVTVHMYTKVRVSSVLFPLCISRSNQSS